MTIWLPDLAGHQGPKYLAIADALAEAIAAGDIPAGAKLPPQRNLACDLGVTLGTVTRAYREAERRGLVDGEVGRGTFVSGPGPSQATRDDFLFTHPQADDGIIDLSHATVQNPDAGRALAAALADISQEPDITALTDYQSNTGLPRHLDAGARWIAARGIAILADDIAISSGVQQGTLAALMALAASGETLLVEELTYPGTLRAAQHLGLRLEPVAMDGEGLLPEALDAACRRSTARLLYCMPSVHNPTTATMSVARRAAVAEAARRHHLHIIEDDVWGAVGTDHPPPLATFAPERTFFISGVAKYMAGGLRIGYVHCPDDQAMRVRSSVHICTWMAAPLIAEIATRWIVDGTGMLLQDRARRECAARVALARERLGRYRMRTDDAISFVWLEMPSPWRASDFRAETFRRTERRRRF